MLLLLLPVFISSIAFWACGEAITTDNCPSGLTRGNTLKVFGKLCLQFEVNNYQTFGNAQKICMKNKGSLAVVTSAKMNQFLQTTFQELSKSSGAFWIGLLYSPDNGSTYYVDHRWAAFYKYENYRQLPIVETNQCVSMSPSDGKWQIEKCSDWSDWQMVRHRFVCEYPASQ